MQIYPFNIVYIFLMLLGAATLMLIWHALRDKPETTRKRVLVIICALNIVFYFVYKGFLSVDAEFLEISGLESFNWFNELPLQLCNINLFLIPLGVMTKKRGVLGFSFFIAPLAAMLALLFPEIAFTGYSLSQPRILGYYVTHLLIVICGLSLFTSASTVLISRISPASLPPSSCSRSARIWSISYCATAYARRRITSSPSAQISAYSIFSGALSPKPMYICCPDFSYCLHI